MDPRASARLPRRRASATLAPVAPLLLGLALAGCNAGAGSDVAAAPPPPPASEPVRVAALLPLSGAAAPIGQSMLAATRLALARSTLTLDVADTGGTPSGAARAATDAVARHDALILGPLKSAETRAAAPIATAAGVPVLAWTSDTAVAGPGVWALGLTPAQQVERLVAAARTEGRKSFAAFLPDGPFGDAMATALTGSLARDGLAPPTIARHGSDFASINDGLKTLSGFANRVGDRDAAIKADRADADPAKHAEADQLAAQPVPPPPFDALLLADTGTDLQEIIELLGPYDLSPASVRIMGPALWDNFARKLGPIAGAWYAAPDPADRAGFVAEYRAKYHSAPRGLEDLAFDTGALAAALATTGDLSASSLARPDGFAGTDGVFQLLPDGRVRRALAVFQIDGGGGSHIVSPAPSRLAPPPGA